MTKTKPLCPLCRDDGGWIIEDPTDPASARRCPCRDTRLTAEQARDEAITAAGMSKPQQLRQAYHLIEMEAEVAQYLSADSVRTAMDAAQIDGSVRSAAFRKAVAEGLLTIEGVEKSLHPPTHGKEIKVYRSRSFSQQLGMGA